MTGPDSQDRLRNSNAVLESTSFLSGANAPFIEELYARWLESPDAVDSSWHSFFAELGERSRAARRPPAGPRPYLRPRAACDDAELLGALNGLWPSD